MFASLLKVTSFYRDFLSDYYRSNPTITGKSYEEQYKHLMAQGYGYADYFPTYFKKNHSLRSAEIIHNAVHLQKAWAAEHGSRQTGNELLLEQIRDFRPEVLFIQDSANFDAGYVDRIRSEVAHRAAALHGGCEGAGTRCHLSAGEAVEGQWNGGPIGVRHGGRIPAGCRTPQRCQRMTGRRSPLMSRSQIMVPWFGNSTQ